jgi:2-polyprenyl-6-methoxyphenol hydroxylase-like FAD-dependent oxidoreductase
MIGSPVVVAGSGLAGAAAAAGLAQAGVEVTLIEREAGPVHRICGEFLSTEAQEYLAKLGLDVGALGGAPISRLRLVRGNEAVAAALPFRGIGLSRFTLDEALLNHAAAQRSGWTLPGLGWLNRKPCCWLRASTSCGAPSARFPPAMI